MRRERSKWKWQISEEFTLQLPSHHGRSARASNRELSVRVRRCTEEYFGAQFSMPKRMAYICAVLTSGAVVIWSPMVRGQVNPAPVPGGDRCPEVCSAAFTRQLSDEDKKLFAQCVTQKKCVPATQSDPNARRQNPLIGPFQRY